MSSFLDILIEMMNSDGSMPEKGEKEKIGIEITSEI